MKNRLYASLSSAVYLALSISQTTFTSESLLQFCTNRCACLLLPTCFVKLPLYLWFKRLGMKQQHACTSNPPLAFGFDLHVRARAILQREICLNASLFLDVQVGPVRKLLSLYESLFAPSVFVAWMEPLLLLISSYNHWE